jgi:hypothetical protein
VSVDPFVPDDVFGTARPTSATTAERLPEERLHDGFPDDTLGPQADENILEGLIGGPVGWPI